MPDELLRADVVEPMPFHGVYPNRSQFRWELWRWGKLKCWITFGHGFKACQFYFWDVARVDLVRELKF